MPNSDENGRPLIGGSDLNRRFVAVAVEVAADGMLQATLSSETPVVRPYGNEILDHAPEAVNLERAAMGLPLLIDHDLERQLGRVENIRLKGRKIVGDIRLSERADLAGIVADVREGIRPDISIGYIIDEAVDVPGSTDWRITKWTLYEVSSVALPADHTVGIGRSFSQSSRKVLTMPHSNQQSQNADPVASERQRIGNITGMATRLNISQDLATRAIDGGWTFDRFINEYQNNAPPSQAFRTAESAPSDNQFDLLRSGFMLTRAIADTIEHGRLSGVEAEVSQELIRRNGGVAPKGFMVPTSALMTRVQTVGTATSAGNLVGQDFMADQFISPLRMKTAVMMAGATVLTDLIGNAVLPRQDNMTAGQWVAEDTAASETNLLFTQVTLSPKTVTGNISWSRQAALQALPSMEQIVRDDLAAQLGVALDRGALHGLGSSNEPRGVFNTSGIGSVALGTNGAAPTYASSLDLESAISTSNADSGNMAYITNTKVRRALKSAQRFTSTDTPVWMPGGTNMDRGAGIVNGYPAYASNNVRDNFTKGTGTGLSGIIFGNWSELIIGLWGGLDLVVDPYTNSNIGRVRISAFLSADISVKRPSSFAAIVDAVAP
jgi:HK97 family phage major capsid protein